MTGVRWGAILAAALVSSLTAGTATAGFGNGTPAFRGIVNVEAFLPDENETMAGTGVVLTNSGEILANNDVIRGARLVVVMDVDNGRTYSAKVVGYDVEDDIAVLQAQGASGLVTAVLGNSASTKIGTSVTTYGNVGGGGGKPSTTPGKVVALGRSITAYDRYTGAVFHPRDLIQTDAVLVPGDSGGPFVDSAGRAIGIAVAGSRCVQLVSTHNHGYATAIDRARAIATEIEAGRPSKYVHVGPTAMLGLTIRPDPDFRGLTPGLTVVGLLAGSPVQQAGLKIGDVLTHVDAEPITSATGLSNFLVAATPGTDVRIRWQDLSGSPHTANVTLTSGPPQ